MFAFAGDRFIVRDGAERATLAGGIVLDPEPGRRPFRRAAQRRFLERRAAAERRPIPRRQPLPSWSATEPRHAASSSRDLL